VSAETHPHELPPGLTLSRPGPGDQDVVAGFIADCDLVDVGEVTWTERQLRAEWSAPSFDVERDVWLVRDGAGRIVACGHRVGSPPHTEDLLFLWTVPGLPGETELVRFLTQSGEDRVLELARGLAPADARVSLGAYCLRTATGRGHRLELERMGYRVERGSYLMSVDPGRLDAPSPAPRGVQLRTLHAGEEQAAHVALEEGFSDHFRYVPEPYEDWAARTVDDRSFDPSLTLLAWDGGAIAGVAQASVREDGVGWIDALAVRRPWRGRGIAKALLTALIAELGRRGLQRASLYVDAQNPHGALQLYKSVGMRVAREHDLLLKVLRPEGPAAARPER
jgi:mycothiol synthase